MNDRQILAIVLAGMMAITGCVSIDGTRAELASGNPQKVKNAEETIFTIATEGRNQSGFVQFPMKERIEYVNLASNNDLLLRIIDNTNDGEIIAAATKRIDFSKPGTAKDFVARRFDKLDRVVSYTYNSRGGGDADYEGQKALKKCILSKLTEDEIMALISDEKSVNASIRERATLRRQSPSSGISTETRNLLCERLIAITESPELLWKIFDGEWRMIGKESDAGERLLTLLDKVEDSAFAEKLLAKKSNANWFVNDPDKRIMLLSRLPESRMVELALEGISTKADEYNVGNWERNWDLETAARVAALSADGKARTTLVATVISTIYDIRKISCDEPMYSWTKAEQSKTDKIIAMLPKLSDDEMGLALCLAGSGWRLLIDGVSTATARQILLAGNAKAEGLECALAQKIPSTEIDMTLYRAVKADEVRKIIAAKMPESLKASMKAESEKMIAALMSRAKEAATSTFELDGFYLGMTMADAKTVFLHHFPDGNVKVSKDGYALYVSGQRDPLCRIYTDTKVVYQFNFGKRMLKKWYKYGSTANCRHIASKRRGDPA